MPVGIHKIHPFLAAVFTDRTVKVGVGTWISLIDQPDQIVFHSSFVLRVEAELTIHSFELRT